MSFTEKFDLEEIAYGTTGWSAIDAANMGKIDAAIKSRLAETAGEILAAYQTVYLNSDGKFYRARADGTHQPALGLTIEAAAADAGVRIHRDGDIENPAWSWTVGGAVYLSPGIWGGLTQAKPAGNVQPLGFALTATKMLFQWQPVTDETAVTTTTTTTSSSTTTTGSTTTSSTTTTTTGTTTTTSSSTTTTTA